MRIVAKKTEFANLTEGKEYEGEPNGSFYNVENDKGVISRYHARHFDTTTAAPRARAARPPRPVAPPPNPYLVFQTTEGMTIGNIERICGLSWNTEDNEGIVINVIARVTNTNNRSWQLRRETTPISCGVDYIAGVNEILNLVNRLIDKIEDNLETPLSHACQLELAIAVMTRAIDQLIDTDDHAAFAIMSTNIEEEHGFFYEALDFIATSGAYPGVISNTIENPNSSNMIRVWVIQIF